MARHSGSLPKEAIISSDIGNNCAIGNAYPSFEEGRKYLAPGLFGPCGYGLPSVIGAKIGCPDVPVVGFAGDGAFGIAVNELTAIGRKEWPPITQIVFRNYQWGAEKRNSTLWYDDNFVGTELDEGVSYAKIAKACGLKGVRGADDGGTDRRVGSGDQGPDGERQDHADRSDDQPGTGRAVPARRDEEAGRRCGGFGRRHGPRLRCPGDILVVNAGSSSIKVSVFDGGLCETVRAAVTEIGGATRLKIGSVVRDVALRRP